MTVNTVINQIHLFCVHVNGEDKLSENARVNTAAEWYFILI